MAAENDMNVFTSEIDTFKDLAKNFLWQAVIIPEEGTPLATLFKQLGGTRQFTLRCRTASLPERTVESELTTHWQGSKKVFPGRVKQDGQIPMKFDEFQDWTTSHMFQAWLNLIHNADIGQDGGDAAVYFDQKTGAAVSNYMRDYSAKIKLTCFDSRLAQGSPHDYTLYYCWPKGIHSVSLEQEGDGKIQREVDIRYSTFQETNPEEYSE
jgi:hypothetical protein